MTSKRHRKAIEIYLKAVCSNNFNRRIKALIMGFNLAKIEYFLITRFVV
jgi:hypothetical protein